MNTTTIVVTYNGKPSYRAEYLKRLTEEEVKEVVEEALAGRDPELAEINIYHNFGKLYYGN